MWGRFDFFCAHSEILEKKPVRHFQGRLVNPSKQDLYDYCRMFHPETKTQSLDKFIDAVERLNIEMPGIYFVLSPHFSTFLTEKIPD